MSKREIEREVSLRCSEYERGRLYYSTYNILQCTANILRALFMASDHYGLETASEVKSDLEF